MNVAFAGLRHGHIYQLFKDISNNPNYTIVGAFEEDADARVAAEKNGLVCNFETYEELLSDPRVETVVLGGCFGDRGGMAIKALKAGKHVMADKPLCTSLSELDEIEELTRKTGKKASVMLTMRFEPIIVTLKELIASGALGRINNVTYGGQHPLQYGRRPSWYYEDGRHGGVINDIAIHGIDILRFLGCAPQSEIIGAREWNCYASSEPHFKDCGQYMVTLEDGCGVICDVSYAIPDGVEFALPYYWHFYFWGTKGTVAFNIHDKALTYYVAGNKEAVTVPLIQPKTDFVSDFLDLVAGKEDVIVPMNELFASTREALTIEKFASGGERPAANN